MRGGRLGTLVLKLTKENNDIHRGCCDNTGMRETGKENLYRGCDGGVFGTTATTTLKTTTVGDTNQHHLS